MELAPDFIKSRQDGLVHRIVLRADGLVDVEGETMTLGEATVRGIWRPA